MNRNTVKRGLKILGYVLMLAVGLIAGRLWGAIFDYSQLWEEVADRDSHQAIMRVHVLSQLRLGQVDDAIESLELPLDNLVLMIAHGETLLADSVLELDPRSVSPHRLQALQYVKAYRSLYPLTPTASNPSSEKILARIPDKVYTPSSTCEDPLCTLLKNRNRIEEGKSIE